MSLAAGRQVALSEHTLSMLFALSRMIDECARRSNIWRVLRELYSGCGLNSSAMNFLLYMVLTTSLSTERTHENDEYASQTALKRRQQVDTAYDCPAQPERAQGSRSIETPHNTHPCGSCQWECFERASAAQEYTPSPRPC